jgi:hypothetical protein
MSEAALLLEERFDDPAALAAWTQDVGATVGKGPLSAAAVEDGAVVLRADRATERFLAVSRRIPVEPGAWIRVEGRARAEALDADHSVFDACYVYVKLGQQIQALGHLSGTVAWTAQQGVYRVPEGVSEVEIGVFLAMPGLAAFDDLVVTRVEDPFRVEARGHYVYHLLAGAEITDDQHAANERHYARVRDWFGAADLPPVDFFQYPDRETKQAYTGSTANAHLSGGDIHSIWHVDSHEIVHAFAAAWGDPPPLLGEGLAVHLSGGWQGEDVREYAARVLREGHWIPLDELDEYRKFTDGSTSLEAYAIAGAFVAWLEATHGKTAVETLYRGVASGASPAVVDRSLRKAIGTDLAGAEAALRAWLEAAPVRVRLSINEAFDKQRGVAVAPAEQAEVFAYGRKMAGSFLGGRFATDAEALSLDPTAPYVLYGTPASNDMLAAHAAALPFRVGPDSVEVAGLRFRAEGGVRLYVAAPNPTGTGSPWVIYTATSDALVPGMNATFHGPTGWLVTDAAGRTCGSGFLPVEPSASVQDGTCP